MVKACLYRFLATVALCLFAGPGVTADWPILHGGEAPQVGHARIYGQTDVPVYSYEILKTYPHDTADYTEALFMHDGYLFEGTGQYGKSRIKKWNLQSGQVIAQRALDDRYFGEGAIVLNGRLYQVTYISNTGFVYDADDLYPIASFRYPRQGWGLTTDGEHLIMSDGSAGIYFIDPEGFTVKRTVFVHDSVSEVGFLNELEYVDGDIYANVWQTDYIVRFSAESGKVNGWIDLTGLNPDPEILVYPKVLNGIAYNGESGTLLVTGKNWPSLWHIRLVPNGR